MLTFPAKLLVTRQIRGLSQKQMAAELGISPQYLADLEKGRRGPNPKLCDRLAQLERDWQWPLPPEGPEVRWHAVGAAACGWRVERTEVA